MSERVGEWSEREMVESDSIPAFDAKVVKSIFSRISNEGATILQMKEFERRTPSCFLLSLSFFLSTSSCVLNE